jgi:lipoprotein-releasing system permease protein
MRSLFELSVALKYLIPRKKQLSVSLIALLSVVVISLVVWLVLVFLSVTEGIERGWLQRLTALNAPLRITPTADYYASYYYKADAISARSEYGSKNIAEKKEAHLSDPYDPSEDGELPFQFPHPDLASDGSLKDPVKGLFTLLSHLKTQHPDLVFQDFELSGALMRLQLLRPGNGGENAQGYLTQASYIASIPDQCPSLSSLLLPPRAEDLNHLLYLSSYRTDLSRQDSPSLTLRADQASVQGRIEEILSHVNIHELKPQGWLWQMPVALLPEKKVFQARAVFRGENLSRIEIPTQTKGENVRMWKEGSGLVLEDASGRKTAVSLQTPLLVEGSLPLSVEERSTHRPLFFKVRANLQGIPLKGEVSLEGLEVSKAETPPFFALDHEKETGVLLAKSYLDNGVKIGDRGYLSYSSTTSSSLQEHRLPIFVQGFYDPGVFAVGNKCILAPSFVPQTINASSSSFNLDKTQSNGVLVWFSDLASAEAMKGQIQDHLAVLGIGSYWKVTTFREYDFAKDLMEQFQSDKYLFALVGIIILIVACCNIVSMLVLLVNDKKKEIGILQAMGASRLSIAAIFGACGMALGVLSSLVGIGAALVTLRYIDSVVRLLSYLQGHEAFHTTFFGKSLPNTLSHDACLFLLIATPVISLLAGLIPAIKACFLRPSEILRSES